MVVLVSREKIISRCINDKRQKATTYSKFPPYSQTASQNGLLQDFHIAKNLIYGILFLAKQLRQWKKRKRPTQEKIGFNIV